LPYPTDSPEIAPRDFFLFGYIKGKMSGLPEPARPFEDDR
jgi:hypothetical protein